MKVNPVGKILSKVERAYLAGLIDGDGAIMACLERHQEKKVGFRVRLNVKLTFSRRSDADGIHKLLGVGYVRQNKRSYDWETKDQMIIVAVIMALMPYFRLKKKQANIALQIAKISVRSSYDLKRAAKLADQLASFNLRSSSRRRNYASLI